MQWLQDPNQSNVDNLNNVRRKASTHFRKNKKEYLKAKLNEQEAKSKTRLSETSMAISQNIVMDEKCDMGTDPHSILARRRNHFSQLLNVHWVNDVRKLEIRKAEPLVTALCL